MNRIGVIVYNISDYGGVSAVATNLVNALSNDYEVYFMSVLDDGNPPALEVRENIKIIRFVNKEKRLLKQIVSLAKPLLAFLKQEQIEVLLSLSHYTGFLTSVGVLANTKIVFCDHGALLNQWDDKKARIIRYIAAQLSDKVVTLTDKTRKDYIERFRINPKKIKRIFNWIEDDISDSTVYKAESKKIISVGRLSSEKGFDQLIKVMALVSQKHPDWSADIFGDGVMLEFLEKEIERLKLTETVYLRGRKRYVRNEYKKYAMYVLPSYREGLPMTLLEAKKNMLPIVSFDIDTGPREIVRDGIDGMLVEQKNIKEMAQRINWLIENPSARIMMASEAKGNLKEFSKEQVYIEWKTLIDELIEDYS